MQKKVFLSLCLTAGAIGLASCSNNAAWWNDGDAEYKAEVNDSMFDGEYMSANDAQMFANNPSEAARVYNKRVPPLNSLVVCRAKQCAPAEMSMSREYIFNSLAHLVDNNLDATALLCEANPQAHVCTNPYLTVPAKIGVTPAYVFFDGVKIIDASVAKGKTALNLALGYNLSYNGQTPTVCKPDTAMMYVKSNNAIVLNGNGFKCDMTSVGTTTVRVMFDIDYIDLDYGYIGGYYSIGLSGPANGGGSGYGLIRLVNDAHPLSPELTTKEESESLLPTPKPAMRPDIKSEALDNAVEDVNKGNEIKAENKGDNKVAAELKTETKPRGKLRLSNDDGAIKPVEIKFEGDDDRKHINAVQPVRITPDTVVRANRVIIKPEPQELRPIEVDRNDEEPTFEEIEADDLDEYIK